jgi:hypothetical protein
MNRPLLFTGAALLLTGLVLVGYSTSWIVAVGIYLAIWGNNVSQRIR